MRALLATAAATALAAGCGGPMAPQAHKHVTASAAITVTRLQACQQLRDDVTRNRGIPDILTLRRIADHVNAPHLAADARTTVRDIGHTGIAPVAITLLQADCAQAGVRIQAP